MTDVVDRAVADVLRKGGERITGINGTTRDGIMGIVRDTVSQGMDDGLGINEMYRNLEEALGDSYLFNDVRSELIARTETALAYNGAALGTYSEFGVERVQAIDGDDDEVCAERNGQDFSIEEAANIEDHPNGTLDWVPFFETGRGVQPEEIAPPVEEVTAASTPADIINANGTAPVSSAFDEAFAKIENNERAASDAAYRAVVDKVKSALATIDDIFTDGNLSQLPTVRPLKNAKSTVQGLYARTDEGPLYLEVRENAKMETVFHEVTHFVDHAGLGYEGTYASELGFAEARGRAHWAIAEAQDKGRSEAAAQLEARAKAMEPVARAIMDSDAWKVWDRVIADGELETRVPTPTGIRTFVDKVNPADVPWYEYSQKPPEAFARAMAQYIAKREGGAAAEELDSMIYRRVPGKTYIKDGDIFSEPPGDYIKDEAGKRVLAIGNQWDWEDFQAIDDAITGMLREVGWLIE